MLFCRMHTNSWVTTLQQKGGLPFIFNWLKTFDAVTSRDLEFITCLHSLHVMWRHLKAEERHTKSRHGLNGLNTCYCQLCNNYKFLLLPCICVSSPCDVTFVLDSEKHVRGNRKHMMQKSDVFACMLISERGAFKESGQSEVRIRDADDLAFELFCDLLHGKEKRFKALLKTFASDQLDALNMCLQVLELSCRFLACDVTAYLCQQIGSQTFDTTVSAQVG